MKFIQKVTRYPKTGEATIVYANGTVSHDLSAAQFLMEMQDRDKSLADAKAYAKLGPMMMAHANWDEVDRILASFTPDGEVKR